MAFGSPLLLSSPLLALLAVFAVLPAATDCQSHCPQSLQSRQSYLCCPQSIAVFTVHSPISTVDLPRIYRTVTLLPSPLYFLYPSSSNCTLQPSPLYFLCSPLTKLCLTVLCCLLHCTSCTLLLRTVLCSLLHCTSCALHLLNCALLPSSLYFLYSSSSNCTLQPTSLYYLCSPLAKLCRTVLCCPLYFLYSSNFTLQPSSLYFLYSCSLPLYSLRSLSTLESSKL